MEFTESFERMLVRPNERNIAERIADDQVLDEEAAPLLAEPRECYFQIRLAEMSLANTRELWREFVPLVVAAVDFMGGGGQSSPSRQVIPRVLGSRAVAQDSDSGRAVQYRNLEIAGWAPYLGGDLGLFVALYRSATSNLVRRLIDTLEQVSNSLQVPTLSGQLGLVRAVADGVSRLAGMDELEFRTGNKQVFLDSGARSGRLQGGYLTYVNGPPRELPPSHLWVREGRLFFGQDARAARPLEGYDYCLVRIRLGTERGDYEALPFHSTWLIARSRALAGDHAVARGLIVWCGQQIAESPDLVEAHKDHLIKLYYGHLERAIERSRVLHGGLTDLAATKRSVHRGPVEGTISPKSAVQRTAQRAVRGGLPQEALNGLETMAKRWHEIFDGDDAELTSGRLNAQMAKLRAVSEPVVANPRDLADAIAVGTQRED